MSVNRWGVSGLIATKAADILSTGYALSQHPQSFAEANGVVAESMNAIGVWPAMLVIGAMATVWIVLSAEWFNSKGFSKLRVATYSLPTLLWGIVAARNVWLLTAAV